MKLIALAIVLGAVIVAVATILTDRHTFGLAREGTSVWRLDQLTGELRYCGINTQSRERGCVSLPSDSVEKY